MSVTVLNRFEQTSPALGNDNKLILAGSVESGAGTSLKNIYLTMTQLNSNVNNTVRVPLTFSGTLIKATLVLESSFGVAETGTYHVEVAGSPVTGSPLTVTDAESAPGFQKSLIPTGANTFVAGDSIEVQTTGSTVTTGTFAYFLLELQPD